MQVIFVKKKTVSKLLPPNILYINMILITYVTLCYILYINMILITYVTLCYILYINMILITYVTLCSNPSAEYYPFLLNFITPPYFIPDLSSLSRRIEFREGAIGFPCTLL